MKTKNAQIEKLTKDLTETELLLGSVQRKAMELERNYMAEKKACEERGNMIINLQRDIADRNERIQVALRNLKAGKEVVIQCRSGETSVLALRAILTIDSTERILTSV